MRELYSGNVQPKRLSRREIEEMKKNMGKIKAIQEKAKKFQKLEEERLEQDLEKLFGKN
ncbi:MAG: hypothetical protein PHU61_00270 [Candidatus Absconditabacteria bacterium]|nr:hypothetical protein [Candidatus Absconditabacteria bacterium]MDD3868637.1 hypothetical protein [Candidatus Absconditabacteria bacterium]MDD4714157.1 hypothetical protein [Candidatus Absconditabacteria bacterium]